MKADAQRAALVETGLRLFHQRGFTATGVREIAAAAGVPQGSFTNHFRSKEAFGLLILERYLIHLESIMDASLRAPAKPPGERLGAYFEAIEEYLAAADWRTGCLVADLGTEVPVHSEVLRRRLCGVLERQTDAFAGALRDRVGERVPEAAVADLAGFVLAAWHGTLLRMKTEQSPVAIRTFRRALDLWLPRADRPAPGAALADGQGSA